MKRNKCLGWAFLLVCLFTASGFATCADQSVADPSSAETVSVLSTPSSVIPVTEVEKAGVLTESSNGTVTLALDGLKITATPTADGSASIAFQVPMPPGDGGGKDGDGGGGSGGSDNNSNGLPMPQLGLAEPAPASAPEALPFAERYRQCIMQGTNRTVVSVIANLFGGYAEWSQNVSELVAAEHLVGAVHSGFWEHRVGLTWPKNYVTAWKDSKNFRYNNFWNLAVMGALQVTKCIRNKQLGYVLLAAVSTGSSMASQLVLHNKIELRKVVLDVGFIFSLTIPRSLIVDKFVDNMILKRLFNEIPRNMVLAGINLGDQWFGGWGYGQAQRYFPQWWYKGWTKAKEFSDAKIPAEYRDSVPPWFKEWVAEELLSPPPSESTEN